MVNPNITPKIVLITANTRMASMAIAIPPSQPVLKLALKTPTQAINATINAQMYAPEPTKVPNRKPATNKTKTYTMGPKRVAIMASPRVDSPLVTTFPAM